MHRVTRESPSLLSKGRKVYVAFVNICFSSFGWQHCPNLCTLRPQACRTTRRCSRTRATCRPPTSPAAGFCSWGPEDCGSSTSPGSATRRSFWPPSHAYRRWLEGAADGRMGSAISGMLLRRVGVGGWAIFLLKPPTEPVLSSKGRKAYVVFKLNAPYTFLPLDSSVGLLVIVRCPSSS